MKFRRDRRFDMKRENPVVFYPRYAFETIAKMWGYWRIWRQFKAMLDEAEAAPDRWTYSDIAIAPPQSDEFESLSLYHETTGGEAALARKRRDDTIRTTGHAPDGSAVESAALATSGVRAPKDRTSKAAMA
jgi:hypothetical protein